MKEKIKENYPGEYENVMRAAQVGLEASMYHRKKLIMHLRQCQEEAADLSSNLQLMTELVDRYEEQNKRMREAIKTALSLFRKWGDSQALEVLDEVLKEVEDE